jgi:hypothetical protein
MRREHRIEPPTMSERLDDVHLAKDGTAELIHNLRGLIQGARHRAIRAVDSIQVQTCWEIGRHIVVFEQGGSRRAEYRSGLMQTLASTLVAEFGKGFDASNLRYMRLFYQAFPIRDALRHELSWTHYRTLSKVETNACVVGCAVHQAWSDQRQHGVDTHIGRPEGLGDDDSVSR